MKKTKKIKTSPKSLGVTLLYTLIGTGCGLEEPPPSFGEKPRASIFFTIENDVGDELIASDDAVWTDDQTDEDLIDQILREYQPEIETTENIDDADSRIENQLPSYSEDIPGTETQDDYTVSPAELNACAQLQGVHRDQVKMAGSQNQASIRSGSVIAARVTGNQNQLDLHIASYMPSSLKGVCIFASGNQNQIQVFMENVMLDAAYLIVRGNQNQIHMSFNESYTRKATIDLAGNQSHASLKGLPDANCPQAVVRARGKDPRFECL